MRVGASDARLTRAAGIPTVVEADMHGWLRSHAALVQVLGRTLLLYRRRPDDKSRRASESRPHVLPR